jgi:osmoprotectant transport system ATP-binding protein
VIEFEHVTQKYGATVALKDLNLRINDGELFVLVGRSGSGKTTLLRMINRLNDPTQGRVLIDGVDVAKQNVQRLRQHIGYVLQSGALFPNMTVEQNAAIELEVLGWGRDEQKARVRDLLKKVGLQPDIFAQRMPSELSGGQAQRVGIVRALAAKPKLILMDEPFSALDPTSRRQLQDLVLRLHREIGVTVVFVTHDMREAIRMADRVAVMSEGILQQCAEPQEVVSSPANDVVRGLFEEENSESLTLATMISAGFGHPVGGLLHVNDGGGEESRESKGCELKGYDSVFDLAAALKEQSRQSVPEAAIRVGGTLLTQGDLMAYLASRADVDIDRGAANDEQEGAR